jgi:DNA-binding FrmR family transcriptional regulator
VVELLKTAAETDSRAGAKLSLRDRRNLIYTLGDYLIKRARAEMSDVAQEKSKLLNRLRRLKGQIEALERSVEQDHECARVLQQATSCRGAMDGFIAEVIEDHIREHMIDPAAATDDPRRQAAEDLVEIVHAYLA